MSRIDEKTLRKGKTLRRVYTTQMHTKLHGDYTWLLYPLTRTHKHESRVPLTTTHLTNMRHSHRSPHMNALHTHITPSHASFTCAPDASATMPHSPIATVHLPCITSMHHLHASPPIAHASFTHGKGSVTLELQQGRTDHNLGSLLWGGGAPSTTSPSPSCSPRYSSAPPPP